MTGFVPPPYPYDRLAPVIDAARGHDGGAVDLSIGTPCDAPPAVVLEAMASSNAERGYPASIGSPAYREAASRWVARRLGAETAADRLPTSSLAATGLRRPGVVVLDTSRAASLGVNCRAVSDVLRV